MSLILEETYTIKAQNQKKKSSATQSISAPLAKWNRLGSSCLKVHNTILGCMQYGSSKWMSWAEDKEEAVFEILKAAYDKGLRAFDPIEESYVHDWIYRIPRGHQESICSMLLKNP